MKRIFLSVLSVIAIASLAYAADKCSLCGMKVDEAKRQYYIITTKDGAQQKACNQGCAVMFLENIKDNAKSVEAVDYNSGKSVDARKAFYVKGSGIRAVMGGDSVVAFTNKEDAERFQKENGGKVVAYEDLFKSGEQDHKEHKH